MYSLLLMSALAAGPDASAFGGKLFAGHGCCSAPVACYGCCGYSYGCCGYSYGCCGYSYGCCGYSYGCCGGYTSCCGGGLFHHKHRSYSCCGGYYPSSCCGCCGGYAYGCCGGACWGSCYGSYYGPAYGCSGCFGYGVIVGGPVVVEGLPTLTPAVTTPAAPAPASVPATTSSTSESPAVAPARLVIELPPAAKLFVDGKPTRGDGNSRLFHTPPLPAGQAFFYEMRAEVEVDGKLEVEERRVVVRGGDSLTESFPKLTAALAAAKSTAVAAK